MEKKLYQGKKLSQQHKFEQDEKFDKETKLDREQNLDQEQKLDQQREFSRSWTRRKTTGVEDGRGAVAGPEVLEVPCQPHN